MISLLKSVLSRNNESLNIIDRDLINSFISNPEFPWLISFPRTGSHWLRMMMELYFEKPSLVRVFYYKNAKSFTCYHQHDENLSLEGVSNVIYICRNPTDTVFSILQYYKEDINDEKCIKFRTNQYSDHLGKWLLQENFTKKKLVITYEGLKENLYEEFSRLTNFFDLDLDRKKLDRVVGKVSKEELSKKTKDNKSIVNVESNYDNVRKEFRHNYSAMIANELLSRNPKISSHPVYKKII